MVTINEKAAFSARLNKALDEAGYPSKGAGRQVRLAKDFGVSQKGARKWVEGESIPATARATEMAKALKINVEWLLSGQGPMRQQGAEIGEDVRDHTPLISWVDAGKGRDGIAEICVTYDAGNLAPCPVPHGPSAFVLKVRGMSMEPEYRDGDWIFVDPDRQPENGSHVVVRLEHEEEATFKKLVIEGHKRYLMALNPAWPDRVIEVNGNARIVGTVIFSGKPR